MSADPKDVDIGEPGRLNESYDHGEPARMDYIGMRYAENDPTVLNLGSDLDGESQTDLGLEVRRGSHDGNDVGRRLACPPVFCGSEKSQPVYSNPSYNAPRRTNLRRYPSLDRPPSRAASASTVGGPSVSNSTADLVDKKKDKKPAEGDGKAKSKIQKFFSKEYEKPRAIILIILLIIILILIIVLPIVLSTKSEDKKEEEVPSRPVALTLCGNIEGTYVKNVSIFKGIPYALNPSGNRRWEDPKLFTKDSCTQRFPADKPYDASTFGPQCYQRLPNGAMGGDEDCLYLNIWRPKADDENSYPVIVFIHGGQLTFGSGEDIENYGVTEFVDKYKVVVVSMNYRLGPFGFMTLPIFPDNISNRKSGNYGLKDQIAALKWIQQNIASFGGMKTKVTLLGWESGGTSALALMTSKTKDKADGLFHHVWIMDAGFIRSQTLAESQNANAGFLQNTGCELSPDTEKMDCLKAKSSKQLMNAIGWGDNSVTPQWNMPEMYDIPEKDKLMPAMIVLDGDVVEEPILQSIKNGIRPPVPVVIGNGESAADLAPPYFSKGEFPYLSSTDEAKLKQRLDNFSPGLLDNVESSYPPPWHGELGLTTMISDMRGRCPTDAMAKNISGVTSSPIYRYIFKTETAVRLDALKRGYKAKYAFRGMDMMATFGAVTNNFNYFLKGNEKFQEDLQRSLSEFARTGTIPGWSTFPNSYMLLDGTKSETLRGNDSLLFDCATFVNAGITADYAWMN